MLLIRVSRSTARQGCCSAKDRPNFIANRIGTFGSMVTIKTMLDDGYSIEEIDKITGQSRGPTEERYLPYA